MVSAAVYSVSRSFLTAAIWRRSKSVKRMVGPALGGAGPAAPTTPVVHTSRATELGAIRAYARMLISICEGSKPRLAANNVLAFGMVRGSSSSEAGSTHSSSSSTSPEAICPKLIRL